MQCPSALNAARSESETLRNLSIAQRSAVDDEHFFTANVRLAAEQVECRTRLPLSRFLDQRNYPRPVFSTSRFLDPGEVLELNAGYRKSCQNACSACTPVSGQLMKSCREAKVLRCPACIQAKRLPTRSASLTSWVTKRALSE